MKTGHFDHDQDYRPGRSEEKNAEHYHVFCSLTCGFDQVLATEITAGAERFIVVPSPPVAGVSLEKTIRLRKTAILELADWLHG